jgi:hypothetical protein
MSGRDDQSVVLFVGTNERGSRDYGFAGLG